MKCGSVSCSNPLVILTDPKNGTYDFKEGIRKHEQDFVPGKGGEGALFGEVW